MKKKKKRDDLYPPDIIWWSQREKDRYKNLLEWAEKYEKQEEKEEG